MESKQIQNHKEWTALRVGKLQSSQLSEFLSYEEPNTGKRVVLAHFRETTLAEIGGTDLFTGDVFVRMKAGVTPDSLPIFERLFEVFSGNFRMGFQGTFQLKKHYADVSCLTIPNVYLQPNPGSQLVSGLHVDENTGEIVASAS